MPTTTIGDDEKKNKIKFYSNCSIHGVTQTLQFQQPKMHLGNNRNDSSNNTKQKKKKNEAKLK